MVEIALTMPHPLYSEGDILVDNCRDLIVRVIKCQYHSTSVEKYHQWYVYVQPLTENLEDDTFFKTKYWISEKCLSAREE
jgi:hypothetical protein